MKKRLVILLFLIHPCWAEEAPNEAPLPTLSLTIEEYVQLALNRGIQSQISEENLRTAQWTWQAGKRQITWPTVSSRLSGGRSFSDDDLGTESETDSKSASISLSQPFITGTSLGLTGTVTSADTETDSLGTESVSKTRTEPNLSATLSQPLYLFVKNDKKRSWEINDLQWKNTLEIYKSDQLNIEFNARRLYFELLLSSKTIQIEERKVASTDVLLGIGKTLSQKGRISPSEFNRIKLTRDEDQRRLENARTQLNQNWNQFKDFVLLPPAQETYLTTPLRFEPFNLPLEKLLEEGQESNPFINLSRNNVRFSEISFEQSKEGARPTLDLSGTYGKTIDRSQQQTLEPYNWDAQINLNWTLFDASQTQLSVKQSEASLRNAKRNFENEARNLRVSIKNAQLDVERVERQVSDLESDAKDAEENRNALRERFRKGEAGLSDVFDAEDRLRGVELELAQLLVSYNNALDRLKVLVGRDLSF